MSKIITCLLLCYALVFNSALLSAQKKIKKGVVEYILQLPEGEDTAMLNMMGENKMTVAFSGHREKIDMNMMNGMTRIQTIYNNQSDEVWILTNMMGRKIKVKEKREEVKPKAFTISYKKKDQKTIAGYKCHKAILQTSDGTKMTAYITSKIQAQIELFNNLFPDLEGFPLEYTIPTNGSTLTYKARSVSGKIEKQAFFAIPNDYEEMTKEAFEKEMSNLSFGN